MYETFAISKPTVRILGGDNIKLHKYMPNMREATPSNVAVTKFVIKAENIKRCRLTTFLSVVPQNRDKLRAVESVPIWAMNFFGNPGITAGLQFICKLHSSWQKRQKVISFTNSVTSV